MTAPGWQPESGVEVTPTDHGREALRARLGIAGDDIVFGIVGSIEWTRRRSYCYGLELVAALGRVERSDIVVVVVGDGSGLTHLKELAGRASSRVVFPGRVPREEVPLYLRAMDIASLPQSVDGVGAFRYTTKVSEYLAAGLPLVTGEIPLSYDLDIPGWRLPGDAPWSPSYVEALSSLMNRVTRADLDEMTGRPADLDSLFDAERQRRQVSSFVGDTLRRLS
jgi:glycosyltransferase involved in cell wall biosynthesis